MIRLAGIDQIHGCRYRFLCRLLCNYINNIHHIYNVKYHALRRPI
jgi:hypothetical protein